MHTLFYAHICGGAFFPMRPKVCCCCCPPAHEYHTLLTRSWITAWAEQIFLRNKDSDTVSPTCPGRKLLISGCQPGEQLLLTGLTIVLSVLIMKAFVNFTSAGTSMMWYNTIRKNGNFSAKSLNVGTVYWLSKVIIFSIVSASGTVPWCTVYCMWMKACWKTWMKSLSYNLTANCG